MTAITKDKKKNEIIRKCTKMVKKIGVSTEQVQVYEDCERISDMLCDDIVKVIDDAELRNTIKRMRRLHAKIRVQYAAPFIGKAKDLFKKLPNDKSVLTYHEIEQLLEKVDDEEIIKIEEPGMRALLDAIKHAHDKGHAERKAEIFEEIMSRQ